ncbi:prolyl-tRNA synthetase associated domain-containing protein [archaeon]|jgi:Ala-tRNA(Pro) deacylase|nr:prolyl-tRNA synthetase associated domain-containing protein [archaeon]MBT6697876.1 prolyl-tRNA synthetase associated domain-containing protein [archaeon]
MDQNVQDFLDEHELKYKLHQHPAVFTCAEADIHCKGIPGTACKNLFLKSRKGNNFFLVILPANKKARLDELSKILEAKKLKFANENELKDSLGLLPGSVSILGLLNDSEKKVNLVIDKELWDAKIVGFHPNINTATLEFAQEEFHKLVKILRDGFKILAL